MGFKEMDNSIGFADLVLESSRKNNPSLKNMKKLDKSIDWSRIDTILKSHYTVGTSSEGADDYPPLLLFKCLLLQKWFRINSDPELEDQINDRWSFKEFLKLPLSKPSTDHSTFSRFRGRLSKEVMDQINSEIHRQFEKACLNSKQYSARSHLIDYLSFFFEPDVDYIPQHSRTIGKDVNAASP
jgi:IS5 family transposase